MGDYSELSPIGDGMINVYEGEYGTYHIPDNIMQKAIEMNGGKKLTDRRTKGKQHKQPASVERRCKGTRWRNQHR